MKSKNKYLYLPYIFKFLEALKKNSHQISKLDRIILHRFHHSLDKYFKRRVKYHLPSSCYRDIETYPTNLQVSRRVVLSTRTAP